MNKGGRRDAQQNIDYWLTEITNDLILEEEERTASNFPPPAKRRKKTKVVARPKQRGFLVRMTSAIAHYFLPHFRARPSERPSESR